MLQRREVTHVNGSDLWMKQELLVIKRYAALVSCMMPLTAFMSYRVIDRSDQWSLGLEWVCFILAAMVSGGSVTKAGILLQDARMLKEQIDDETRTAMRDSITTRIQSGEIKPNPDFK